MDTTNQLISIAKRTLREFRVLRDIIRSSSLRIQEKTKTISEKNQRQDKRDQPLPVVRTLFEIPDPKKAQNEGTKTEKKWLNRWKSFIETGTLVAVIAYAVTNSHMLHEMGKATEKAGISAEAAKIAADTAARELELSERPWVFIQHAEVAAPLTFDDKNGTVTFRFFFKNSGNSPAMNVRVHPELFIWDSNHPNISAERDRFCNPPAHGKPKPGMILFPGVTPQEISLIVGKDEIERSANKVIDGGRQLRSGFALLVPIVCIEYFSIFNDTWYYSATVYSPWNAIRIADMKAGHTIPMSNTPLQPNPFFGESAR